MVTRKKLDVSVLIAPTCQWCFQEEAKESCSTTARLKNRRGNRSTAQRGVGNTIYSFAVQNSNHSHMSIKQPYHMLQLTSKLIFPVTSFFGLFRATDVLVHGSSSSTRANLVSSKVIVSTLPRMTILMTNLSL